MPDPETPERLALALSQEELYVLLSYLKAPAPIELEDFETRVFQEVTSEQKRTLLQVVERCLFAREYLWLNEDRTLAVNPAVARVIEVCAMPEQSWFALQRRRGEAGTALHIHRRAELFASLSTPLDGIYELVVFPDDKLIQETLFDLVAASAAKATTCPPGTIPADVFGALTDGSQPVERRAVAAKLTAAGLAPATAEGLAQSLEGFKAITVLTRIAHPPGKEPTPEVGATVVADDATLWLLEPDASGRLSVRSGDAKEVQTIVRRVVGGPPTSAARA